jgi:alpha-L-fucosidase
MLNLRAEWLVMNQSLPKQKARERFNERKFGMFIHWGLYAIPGGIWKGQRMEEGNSGPQVAEWIMRTKEISREEYGELAEQFNPARFDAREWVDIARSAGIKYLVITAKHHDGFALYESDVSHFNSVDGTPFGRDIIRELEQACQAAGLGFGVYYSHNLDWRHGGNGGLLDYAPENPERLHFANFFDPSPTPYDEYIRDFSLPQVRELLTRYKLSLIFFDTPLYIPPKYSFAFYKQVYGANPEILVTERIGNGFGDVGTPGDNKLPDAIQEQATEVIATTNNSWGYKSYDTDWKSPSELLYLMLSSVSRGANFLLNVGPDGQGEIPPGAVAALKDVGDWMAKNGDAIYGTTAWVNAQEGPTRVAFEGTDKRMQEGFNATFSPDDFWFTRKGNTVYAIALARPASKVARIRSLSGLPIKNIRVLGESGPVTWHDTGEYIETHLPSFHDDTIGYALEISF